MFLPTAFTSRHYTLPSAVYFEGKDKQRRKDEFAIWKEGSDGPGNGNFTGTEGERTNRHVETQERRKEKIHALYRRGRCFRYPSCRTCFLLRLENHARRPERTLRARLKKKLEISKLFNKKKKSCCKIVRAQPVLRLTQARTHAYASFFALFF